jgi:drug/metabolite transporter (DMT)-like permease
MRARLSEGQIGTVLVAASAFAFSTGGFFTRLIDLDVWTVLFWRGLFGGLTILAFIGWLHQRQTLCTFLKIGRDGMAVALCTALATICFINALRQTDVADVFVISATTPFATAALAWLWPSEREERSTLVACVVAVIGIFVMMNRGLTLGGVIGNLLALLMVFFLATMMVIVRKSRHVSMLPATCLSAFLCALLVLPVSMPVSAHGATMAYLVLFGATQFGLGLLLLTIGTRMISATRSALIGCLDTPLAPIWVWLAFGEAPALATWVGGAIVLAAVVGDILTRKAEPELLMPDEAASRPTPGAQDCRHSNGGQR